MQGLLLVVTARWAGRVKRASVEENIFCVCMQQGRLTGCQCFCCFLYCFFYLTACSFAREQFWLIYNPHIRFRTNTHHSFIRLCTHTVWWHGCMLELFFFQWGNTKQKCLCKIHKLLGMILAQRKVVLHKVLTYALCVVPMWWLEFSGGYLLWQCFR